MASEQGGTPFNFERVEYGPPGQGTDEQGPLACRNCQTALTDTYHDVGGNTVCGACRRRIETALTGGPGAFWRALVYGIGAALAGALVYYIVLVALRMQIGFVAILVGYMVGRAIRKAVPGGGRTYQIMAVLLTYWGITLSYVPVLYGNFMHRRGVGSPAYLLAYAFATSLIVPVLRLTHDFSGILTPLIIGFGLWQAWKLTQGREVPISGPFPVAARGSAGASI